MSRTYQSASGVTWRVMQWTVGRSPLLAPAPALIFRSAQDSTELREFPRDWMHLTDAELETLRESGSVPSSGSLRAVG